MEEMAKLSPMMVQWKECKEKAKEAVLLFRLGDFYEAFFKDAEILSKELDLTLTKRQEIPMSGIPHHASLSYIEKLLAKGYQVAIAEQMEEAGVGKGIVRREVVKILSPGTLIESSFLPEKSNTFISAIFEEGGFFYLVSMDLSTAEFKGIFIKEEESLLNELSLLHPKEIVLTASFKKKYPNLLKKLDHFFSPLLSEVPEKNFHKIQGTLFLKEHFKVHTLISFGIEDNSPFAALCAALLHYLKEERLVPIDHIQSFYTYSPEAFLQIDPSTLKNLELLEPIFVKGKSFTLFNRLDETETPMGARLLKEWIKRPLRNKALIEERQEALSFLVSTPRFLETLLPLFHKIGDLERVILRLSTPFCSPKDLSALKCALPLIAQIKNTLFFSLEKAPLLKKMYEKCHTFPELSSLLERALEESVPLKLGDGKTFKEGFSKDLDTLLEIQRDSKGWMNRYQNELKETLGIKTLKIGYTRMFGYYIEVSKGQSDKVPVEFERRQSLINADRFVTKELKEYENTLLNAQDKITAVEKHLFEALKKEITPFCQDILETAKALSVVDVLLSLSSVAQRRGYVKPSFQNSFLLEIEGGKHPLLEEMITPFIANDTFIGTEENKLHLITGPNMAGKSTYMRQVALLTIMAHMGSFIPAKKASFGLVDKIFTRIGASDDLAQGLSTFMVEMTESAYILNHLTESSLVIFDEIGRGTSTFDGISIAWAIAESLLEGENPCYKVLFATHYFELTELEEKIKGALNFHIDAKEQEEGMVFSRKISRGKGDKSFGITVAKMAGISSTVTDRAKVILSHLEKEAPSHLPITAPPPKKNVKKLSKKSLNRLIENEEQMCLF